MKLKNKCCGQQELVILYNGRCSKGKTWDGNYAVSPAPLRISRTIHHHQSGTIATILQGIVIDIVECELEVSF